MSASWSELWRFGVSGALNTLLAYAVYAGLIVVGAHYVVALIADYTFAIVFSLLVNKFFTFRESGELRLATVISMLVTYGVLFLVNWLIAFLLVDVSRINPLWSQAVATVVVGGFSFLLQRNFVFHPRMK